LQRLGCESEVLASDSLSTLLDVPILMLAYYTRLDPKRFGLRLAKSVIVRFVDRCVGLVS
jgi:hypothetical protein